MQISSLTVGDGKLAVPVAELSVGTDQKLVVTLRDDLGKLPYTAMLQCFPLYFIFKV